MSMKLAAVCICGPPDSVRQLVHMGRPSWSHIFGGSTWKARERERERESGRERERETGEREEGRETGERGERHGNSLYTLTPDRPPPGGKYW